jgi:hypothetical protein
VHWWTVAAIANTVIGLAYLGIAFVIWRGLIVTRQWRSNPLAAATGAIFFTCAVHHGAHAVHMLLPAFGVSPGQGGAMRLACESWHAAGWDVIGAGVALWYRTLRERFPALVRGAALFEDLKQRQHQALEINDEIVQGLAVVKCALDAGDTNRVRHTAELTLASSRRIISDLLGERGGANRFGPGDLVRARAATIEPRVS